MHLKKLEIRGFKTFADTTTMEFAPGVTAVVGPNGSGKSNISDAIAWVMGESNVRNLRANKTEDVIFNGSAKRKPVGLAEVSVTFDNSHGRLPIGFDEVTVTRRAFRSGDSEYFINKVPCRLRDIYELFLDSGMGRGAYSMVSQGQIDELLTGKPEDRRELIEEAAGVKKYRHRRSETVRKLDHTQANLDRVDDIMNELQGQMEPLAEQAETAIRYKELSGRLREIEVGLLVSRVQKLNDDITIWRETEKDLHDRLADLDSAVESLGDAETSASLALREAQEELEAAHSEHSQAQMTAERLRSDLAIADAKRQSVEDGRRRIQEEIEALEIRLEELSEQFASGENELRTVTADKLEFEEKVALLRSQVDSLQADLAEREKDLAEQEAGARALAQDKAGQQSRLENSIARAAELESEIKTTRERLEGLSARRAERADEAERASQAAETESRNLARLSKSLEEVRSALEEEKDNLDSSAAAFEEISRLMMERSSRLKTLQDLQDAREGYYAGVRAVMAAVKRKELPNDFAVVADILDVPAEFGQAIETALGGALQDIATSSFDLAKQAIEFLKRGSLGRATFLPMDRLDRPGLYPQERLKEVKGILGTAYDLVGFEPKYEPVARLLLGRALVAKNIDFAGEAAKKLAGWAKIVTPDGELLLPSGAITGGSRQKKSSGLIERKREIADLKTELEKLTVEQELSRAAVASLKQRIQELTGRAALLQADVEQARVRLARAEGARNAAASSLRELEDAEKEASGRMDAAQQQILDLKAEIETLEKALNSSDAADEAMNDLLASQREELQALQSRRQVLADELRLASSGLATLTERETALRKAGEQCAEEIERHNNALAARRRELEELEESGEEAGMSAEDLSVDADAAQGMLEEAQIKLMTCQARVADRNRDYQAAASAFKENRELREEATEELHQTQVLLARGESEFQQSLDRLWEDYEITKGDALSWPEPLLIKHGTVTEVARLRKEIRAMGDVNTGAIAEFERVRERWEFLAGQRADLEEAKRQLLEAIREIDDSTRELFLDTFNQVKTHFGEIFSILFEGGVAQIELTKPDNLLETGIEVFVQPPGKNLQNMDLLSGGEKALTAQALLFALMRVKPSPFCVLDEVDAPLDDANVGRFANLVKQYANGSQFIVITHNRATMEAADTLYGVTMQEPGISRIISARLTDE